MSLKERIVASQGFKFLAKHFQLLAALATLLGIGLALYSQREAIYSFDWSVSKFGLLAGLGLLAVAPLVQAFTFWMGFRMVKARSPLLETLLVWARSFLLRYAPGGALTYIYRVRAKERLNTGVPEILTVTAYEQLLVASAGAMVSLLCFLAAGIDPPGLAWGLGITASLTVLLLGPRFLGNKVRSLLKRFKIEIPILLRGRDLNLFVFLNAGAWIATGWGNLILIRALTNSTEFGFFYLTATFALAWVVGVLIPFLPGGLGVREGMLVVFLSSSLGAGVAVTIVLALRLVGTLAEFLAIGLIELTYLLWGKERVELETAKA